MSIPHEVYILQIEEWLNRQQCSPLELREKQLTGYLLDTIQSRENAEIVSIVEISFNFKIIPAIFDTNISAILSIRRKMMIIGINTDELLYIWVQVCAKYLKKIPPKYSQKIDGDVFSELMKVLTIPSHKKILNKLNIVYHHSDTELTLISRMEDIPFEKIIDTLHTNDLNKLLKYAKQSQQGTKSDKITRLKRWLFQESFYAKRNIQRNHPLISSSSFEELHKWLQQEDPCEKNHFFENPNDVKLLEKLIQKWIQNGGDLDKL